MKIYLRRFTCLLLLGILTFVISSACSINVDRGVTNSKQSTEDCRVVQHMMGKTCIPRNPQRVITLRPEHLANSLALSIEPVASAFIEDFPFPKDIQSKVDKIESVGDLNNPNLEKILRLNPDLIISNSRLKGIYKQLSQIAPTVVLNIPFPPPSWKEQLTSLAQILEKEDVSQQLIDDYWQRVEKLKQALGSRRNQIEVSVANTSSEHGIWVYGEKHYVGEVLSDIGLQRPSAQKGDFFYIENISKEKMSDIDGDVLFFVTFGRKQDKETLNKLINNPLWQKLQVVQNKQVYFVDGYWHDAGSISAINAILDDLFKYLVNT
ncbi:MAG: iron-siderophore ABC transporter substrate-binding protein [Richelia sp. RM2_1_2]|nr:iron-siderophore ABC transporter substrate-binding protein [Richelia sp. RM1_1_1]NJO27412.1 iron-siderophore ABC transporter substrate-binding protein [Richelia sp. SL_2_1]NJO60740.1 iron-siderophore ABC transporter substrate-binding protein [Richelia sp. RM2_1_2]